MKIVPFVFSRQLQVPGWRVEEADKQRIFVIGQSVANSNTDWIKQLSVTPLFLRALSMVTLPSHGLLQNKSDKRANTAAKKSAC